MASFYHPSEEYTVEVGESAVTVRKRGSSRVTVAQILGMTRDAAGQPNHIWLDRLVHPPGYDALGDWQVRGAVCTELHRSTN